MADDKFIIVYRRSPEYRVYPANIVYGGPTPSGEGIFVNICTDHNPLPNYVQHDISPDGKVNLAEIKDQAIVGNIEREVLCGLTLSVDEADRLAKWLQDHVNRLRGIQ